MNDWVKALSEGLGETVPEGWETTGQIAKQIGLSADATLGRLKRRQARGLIERQHITVNGVGKTSSWRVIDPEGEKDRGKEKSPARGL